MFENPKTRNGYVVLIGWYQTFISPLMECHCRFWPSCSEYAKTAFLTFHPLKAFWVTLCRLLRCHPFCEGGHDPVISHQNKK